MMIVLAGMVFAIAGAVAGMFGSYMVMGVLGVSDFEGMRAMTAFVLFAPLGAIVGLALGVPLTLRFGAGRTVPPVLVTLLAGAAVLAYVEPTVDDPVPAQVGPEPQATALGLLRADASTEDLLSLTSLDTPLHVREEVAGLLASRADLGPALIERITARDPLVARDAMYFVGQLRPPPVVVGEAVKARAAEIITIAKSIDPADEDSRERLYERVHVLATGVLAAAHGLQSAGIDLRPELRAMADATRAREKAAPRDIADAADRIVAYFDELQSHDQEQR
jgi:hypothetical protein